MMANKLQVNRCRLCINICDDHRCLYDEDGQTNEIYALALKYFTGELLDVEWVRHLRNICMKCYRHLWEFNAYEQYVRRTHVQIYLGTDLMNSLPENNEFATDLQCSETLNTLTKAHYTSTIRPIDKVEEKLCQNDEVPSDRCIPQTNTALAPKSVLTFSQEKENLSLVTEQTDGITVKREDNLLTKDEFNSLIAKSIETVAPTSSISISAGSNIGDLQTTAHSLRVSQSRVNEQTGGITVKQEDDLLKNDEYSNSLIPKSIETVAQTSNISISACSNIEDLQTTAHNLRVLQNRFSEQTGGITVKQEDDLLTNDEYSNSLISKSIERVAQTSSISISAGSNIGDLQTIAHSISVSQNPGNVEHQSRGFVNFSRFTEQTGGITVKQEDDLLTNDEYSNSLIPKSIETDAQTSSIMISAGSNIGNLQPTAYSLSVSQNVEQQTRDVLKFDDDTLANSIASNIPLPSQTVIKTSDSCSEEEESCESVRTGKEFAAFRNILSKTPTNNVLHPIQLVIKTTDSCAEEESCESDDSGAEILEFDDPVGVFAGGEFDEKLENESEKRYTKSERYGESIDRAISEDHFLELERSGESCSSDDKIPLENNALKRKRPTKKERRQSSTRNSITKPKGALRSKSPQNLKGPNTVEEYDAFIAEWRPNLECELCHEMYPKYSTLLQHYAEQHPSEKCQIQCCQVKFYQRCEIEKHISYHRESKGFKCEICYISFGTKTGLWLHTSIKHSECSQRDSLKCPKCSGRYVYKSSLIKHMKYHCGKNEKEIGRHVCQECGNTYTTLSILNQHKRKAHQGMRPRFKCTICDKMFYDASYFGDHMNKHTGKTNKTCIYCPKTFAYSKGVYAHLLREHPREWEEKKKENAELRKVKKTYKCDSCPNVYQGLLALKEHQAIHTGKSLYACKFCSKEYKYRSNLSTHIKKAHNKNLTIRETKTMANFKRESQTEKTNVQKSDNLENII